MEILVFPNNILRKIAEKWDIKSNTERNRISKLIEDMKLTMYGSNGIGLAAPQVGISKRLFIIDVEQKVEKDEDGEVISRIPGELLVFINSRIIHKEGMVIYEEGCLSVPGVYEEVKRAEIITIEYYDENFEKKQMTAEGFLSVVVQHEYDHTEGKLFIDRLPVVRRTLVKNRILKGKNL
ncbi:MAG: peptide deformylase [Proteobacteria bacterium]|nr:peptide deformylase [Pseudomonadota bacterium]